MRFQSNIKFLSALTCLLVISFIDKAFPLSPDLIDDIENNANLNLYEPLWLSDNIIRDNIGNLGLVRNIRNRSYIHEVKFPALSLSSNIRTLQELTSQGFHSFSKNSINASIENPYKYYYLEPKFDTHVITGGKEELTMYFGFETFSRSEFLTIEDEQNSKQSLYQNITYGGFSFGLAKTSSNGILNAGLLLRPNLRLDYRDSEASETFRELDTKDFIKKVYKKSAKTISLAADAGVVINAGDIWLPSLSLSVKNIPTGCQKNYKNPFTNKLETVCGAIRFHFDNISNNNLLVDPMNISTEVSMTPRFRLGRQMVNLKLSAGLNTIPLKIGHVHLGLDYGKRSWKLFNTYAEFLLGNPLRNKKQFFSAQAGLFHGDIEVKLLMFLDPFSIFYELSQFQRDYLNKDAKDLRHTLGISLIF